MVTWLTLTFATFGALLPIVNPFSTAPLFVSLTREMPRAERLDQARRACLYMFAVLVATLLAGALILAFFGISLPALRVAGGLIVARIGFGMLHPEPEQELPRAQQQAMAHKPDPAFTPLAMPMLSGPGSIAVTIGMATEVDTPLENLPIIVGIALVTLVSWLVLRSSARVVDRLGATGVTVLTRIMGLLLVCIGIQFVFRGVAEAVASDDFMRPILDTLMQLQRAG
jgi:multiple antibiotic resistance protein